MLRYSKVVSPSSRYLTRTVIRSIPLASRHLSTSRIVLDAEPIDGKLVARQIRSDIKEQIEEIKQQKPFFQPKLVIVQVGHRPDSSAYVRAKLKQATEVGIKCELKNFAEEIAEDDLLNEIELLNDDPSTHGILVQLPLPKSIDEKKVTDSVVATKDVDGFGTYNIGELARRNGKPLFTPCTPKGIMALLNHYKVDIAGKNAVVIGRSDIVGNPMSYLLKDEDATVTVCHRHTQNLPEIVKRADIVVAAVGIPEYIKGDWIKPGAVVIDVGINSIPDSTKKSGHRLVGDVEYASASKVASLVTPVPGGVGPMTVAMVAQNVFESAKAAYRKQEYRHVTPLPLKTTSPVPSDIDISRAQKPKRIKDLATEVGITNHELEPYGHYKAKVDLSLLDRLQHRKNGKYVLVAGITPTPLGEGKSTTTMGIVQALSGHLGKLSFANVRQPSMGPTFGIKGGAAGGGYSQVIPMDEFNMHLTGDIHAVSAANNLLAAAIDTRMFHEATQKDASLFRRLVPKKGFTPSMLRRLKKLGIDKTDPKTLTPEEITKFARLDIDPETITWRRVVDTNDRYLRGITIGEAPTEKGLARKTGFDISVASEVMAVLALSNSLTDMRERLGRMVIASSKSGVPITCDDIGAGGALTAMMKDAIKPNLMQSLEGTPVMVHAGPFANISIGASSVLADKMALKLAGTEEGEPSDKTGYVVTEAGFDFTMGGERFFNIKCRSSGLVPDAVVIVATVRALKLHGGGPEVKPGTPLPEAYTQENVELVRNGTSNLRKQIQNAKTYGVPVVVAINRFVTDTDAELEAIREEALKAGADDAIPTNHWESGGAGAVELAEGVIKACETSDHSKFKFLYETENSTAEEKLNTIARSMYGASGVELSDLARKKIEQYTAQGFGHLPICIAKTQYSLSHDPNLKGNPQEYTDFKIPIRDVRAAVGSGYLYALAGAIQTIPGLSTYSGFMNVEVNDQGEIEGLF
ncbi:C-1-tetrahydrofolate synthase, mitochondrial [Trichomonascus vanleenenianus]|uniref:C-1-tetrahydrofolate synthase n=1 Tax=Trichomonascus vanleenenianus TaxID=2268995 RepID=UPI003EC9B06F